MSENMRGLVAYLRLIDRADFADELEAAIKPGPDVSRLLEAAKVIKPYIDQVIEHADSGDVPGTWLQRGWLVELSAAIAEHEAAAVDRIG